LHSFGKPSKILILLDFIVLGVGAQKNRAGRIRGLHAARANTLRAQVVVRAVQPAHRQCGSTVILQRAAMRRGD
jgi:hypothetical protein